MSDNLQLGAWTIPADEAVVPVVLLAAFALVFLAARNYRIRPVLLLDLSIWFVLGTLAIARVWYLTDQVAQSAVRLQQLPDLLFAQLGWQPTELVAGATVAAVLVPLFRRFSLFTFGDLLAAGVVGGLAALVGFAWLQMMTAGGRVDAKPIALLTAYVIAVFLVARQQQFPGELIAGAALLINLVNLAIVLFFPLAARPTSAANGWLSLAACGLALLALSRFSQLPVIAGRTARSERTQDATEDNLPVVSSNSSQ